MTDEPRLGSIRIAATLIGTAVLVAGWTILSLVVGDYLVPPPWTTALEFIRLLGTSSAWRQIALTVARVAAGFGIAAFLGTAVGVLTVRPFVAALVKPLLVLMQGMPPILWAIPLILVLGFGGAAPVLVIALICFPLVAVTIGEGVRTAPRALSEMLSVYAGGPIPRLRELYLPHLAPFIVSSVHLGLSLAIKASVVAEYFGADDGVGFQIQTAYQAFQTRKLFAWSAVLIVIVLVADRLLARLRELSAMRRDSLHRSAASSDEPGAVDYGAGAAATSTSISPSLGDDLGSLRATFLHPKSDLEIRISDLSFSYPRGAPILSGVDLFVRSREVVVVSGDSGAGKTTFLALCSGLLVPTGGTATIPDRIGFVFQDDRFLPWRTCLENVSLPLRYRSVPRDERRSFARSMLDEVGLAAYTDRYPAELSGGMKKRLAFARCFAAIPEAVFLDEPFTGLDADSRRSLWSKFAELFAEHPVPVVIVTHFPDEVPERLDPSYYRMRRVPGRPSTLVPA
jgi:ABC-type nitrate/sulfonate/bicarbonate transport system ATPase subunit/ABC-type nitrate/sulfonate/bicarbonate transport system permease component